MSKLPFKYSFVDLETTGTNPRRDRIIEVGVINVLEGQVHKTFSSVVNPQMYIPEEIKALTGISQKDVENAPVFDSIAKTVKELTADSVFVAHNARFDYAFLKHEYFRLDQTFSSKVLCTVKLARRLFPELPRYNLDTIINHFGINCISRHRALDDANATWEFFKLTQTQIPPEILTEVLGKLLKKPSLPPHLTEDTISNLTEGPGVYIMYGKPDTPVNIPPPVLYIGKSVNVRDRVLSHFASDYHSSAELAIAQDVSHIETIETAGELGALIRESQLIKEKAPIFNKLLRRHSDLIVLTRKENSNGYLEVQIEKYKSAQKTSDIVGLFKSKKKATEALRFIAEEYKLCPKLLGLENGKGCCFNFQLEMCAGGCINKENPLAYNIRFIQAFSEMKIPDWPFTSAIGLTEEYLGHIETHVIDKWCYVGSVIDSHGNIKVQKEKDLRFDWDIYKILKKRILSGKASRITILPEEKVKELFS